MSHYNVTIFTPTYNRAHTLPRLYESLKQQTSKDFEWIIVDDGSTDETTSLISPWIAEEKDFELIYVKVKNGGKHRAINKGTQLARGELFFIVDSDDYLVSTAVEKIIEWDSSIEDKTMFAGIAGNKGLSHTELVGKTFDGAFVDATSLEREKYHIEGDKAEVFYTNVLKEYKFPEIEGENFITEFVVWFHLAHDGYKIRWFNDIIYVCEYLEDGLTKNAQSVALKNPKGYQLAAELYQKFYGGFLKKEKEELVHQLENSISKGELSLAQSQIKAALPIIQENLDINLILIQVWLYEGNVAEAEEKMKRLLVKHPNHPKVYLKKAQIGQMKKDYQMMLDCYQKALLYSTDEDEKNNLMRILQQQYGLKNDQIHYFVYQSIKELKEAGEVNQACDLICDAEWFNEEYRMELKFYQHNAYLRGFILGVILNEVDGYEINVVYYPYIYGHAYFNYAYYEQSLALLEKIDEKNMSPLTAYRLSVIYQLKLNDQKSSHYREIYNQICINLKTEKQSF